MTSELATPALHVVEGMTKWPAALETIGLGYRRRFPGGLEFAVNRLRDSKGSVSGELTVSKEPITNSDASIVLAKLHTGLSTPTARKSIATYLKEFNRDVSWLPMVEVFCREVLDRFRAGTPMVFVGEDEREELVARGRLHPYLGHDGASILAGRGGTGKSLFAAGAAVMVETAAEILPGCSAQTAPVLILDWEDSRDVWNSQIRAICRGAGIPPVPIRYRRMAGALADQVEEVARDVTEYAVGLVILDSVEAACGSYHEGEGYNERAQRLFDALRVFGVPCLLLDHLAGVDIDREDAASKPIGGVMKVNRARAVFEMRAEKDPTPERIEVVITDLKRNRRRKLAPATFAMLFDEYDAEGVAHNISFERCEVSASDLVKRLPVVEQITRLLLSNGSMGTKAVATQLNVSEASVRTHVARSRGRIIRLQNGSLAVAQ